MPAGRRERFLLVAVLGGGALMAWAAGSRDLWPLMIASAWLLAAAGYMLRQAALATGLVVAVAVMLRLVWLPLGPSLSDDSFRYAWDGMLVSQGVNPYEYPPSDDALSGWRDHPAFAELNSEDFHSVYPPASQLAFAAAHMLAGGAHPASFYVLKGLVLLLELLAILLLARMVAPGWLLVFAAHPMVLMAGAGQAHTDALLALPLVAAVWAARTDRWGLAGTAVAVATHIKLWPVLAAPAYLRRPRALVAGAAIGVLLALPFAAPGVLRNVGASLDLYVRYFEFNAGPYYAVKEVFRAFTGDDWSKQLGPAFRWVFLLSLPALLLLATRRNWSLDTVLYGVVALLTLTATTVHPWYLYACLLLAVLSGRHVAAWSFLSAVSMGTYLLYTGGPYWLFVILGWTGFALLLLPELAQTVLRRRAVWKADWIAARNPGTVLLDVGGGEGYVADELEARFARSVTVLETESGNTARAVVQYDGAGMPFETGAFDAVYAVFVLHHADDPEALVREMARVTRSRVLVIESVLRHTRDRRLLPVLDRLANGLRAPLSASWTHRAGFRTAAQWRELFERAGLQVTAESGRYNPLHAKHMWVLTKRT